MSRESRLVKNTFVLAIGNFMPKIATFVTLPILTGCLSKEEYYGMFHWYDGSQYCRSCIYNIWQIEEYQHKKYQEELEATSENREPCYDTIKVWQPSDQDYVFPNYSDGTDYSVKVDEYE